MLSKCYIVTLSNDQLLLLFLEFNLPANFPIFEMSMTSKKQDSFHNDHYYDNDNG